MSSTVIKIESLWKEYRYGVVSQGYLFRDVQSWWAKVRGKEDPNDRIDSKPKAHVPPVDDKRQEEDGVDSKSAIPQSPIPNPKSIDRFWALKDINLEIKQGEILGIIGRNGAGKSTLLKILSRVTAPTKGCIKVNGRIGSLLEVGTGFHPELTGRENIFLNGAILGMRKREIRNKFDEIVAFAEVEKFIDTPVKRYSSGMYVRLAFAVAAHLDPEILVVDEVLAVGDTQFQKKCLGKMGEVSKQGRTVLFVSHNMDALRRLCTTCILLQKGAMVVQGGCDEVIRTYLENASERGGNAVFSIPHKSEARENFVHKVVVERMDSKPAPVLLVGEAWQVRVLFRITKRLEHFVAAFGITSRQQGSLLVTWTNEQSIDCGDYAVVFRVDQIQFAAGKYFLNIGLSDSGRTVHYIEDAAYIDISQVSVEDRILRTHGCGTIVNPLHYTIERT